MMRFEFYFSETEDLMGLVITDEEAQRDELLWDLGEDFRDVTDLCDNLEHVVKFWKNFAKFCKADVELCSYVECCDGRVDEEVFARMLTDNGVNVMMHSDENDEP
jgi:hypothetical protein